MRSRSASKRQSGVLAASTVLIWAYRWSFISMLPWLFGGRPRIRASWGCLWRWHRTCRSGIGSVRTCRTCRPWWKWRAWLAGGKYGTTHLSCSSLSQDWWVIAQTRTSPICRSAARPFQFEIFITNWDILDYFILGLIGQPIPIDEELSKILSLITV